MNHSRDGEVCNVRCAGWSVGNCLGAGPNCYTEAEAIGGWNRRTTLAAPVEPVGVEPAAVVNDHYSRDGVNDEISTFLPVDTKLYTAAQVQAMGRVPKGWAVVEREILQDAEEALGNFVSDHDWGDSDMVALDNLSAVLAVAPQPPAAQATTGPQAATTGAGGVTTEAAPWQAIAELCAQMCEKRSESLHAGKQITAGNEASKCAKMLRGPNDYWHAKLGAQDAAPKREQRYRLLVRGVDTIEADDEFLRDDAKTWATNPNGVFVGMTYQGNALLPARRAIERAHGITGSAA